MLSDLLCISNIQGLNRTSQEEEKDLRPAGDLWHYLESQEKIEDTKQEEDKVEM